MSKKSVQAEHYTEILDYQERRLNALKRVEGIEALIEEQEGIIVQAKATIPSLEDFSQKREDLLAEIATGEAQPERLQELDAEIAQRQAEANRAAEEAHRIIPDTEQKILGLRRRLAAAQAQFETLDLQKYELLMEFVTQEAEVAGGDYIRQAESLKETFSRLLALSALRQRLYMDGQRRLKKRADAEYTFTFRAGEIKIPKFNLQVFQPIADWYDGLLFDINKVKVAEAVEVEKVRLHEMGLDLT